MNLYGAFLILLVTHWFADFVLQTDWQAKNKSKDWGALLSHVTSYTVALLLICAVMLGPWAGVLYAAVNGALHFATDAVTSRLSAGFAARQDWHNFFVVVGADQLIHQLTLALTLYYFYSRGVLG